MLADYYRQHFDRINISTAKNVLFGIDDEGVCLWIRIIIDTYN